MSAPVLRILRFPIHIVANCVGIAWRLIPRQRRFDSARAAADVLAPFLRLPAMGRLRSAQMMETPSEVALQMVLRTLDRVGTAYDPIVRVHGAEPFAIAREAGRGLLMIGPHAALSKLVVRYLCDQEYSPIIVVADSMRFGGMQRPPRQILMSPNFLVRVRTELRAGSIVGAMADHEPDTAPSVRGAEARRSRAVIGRPHSDRAEMRLRDSLHHQCAQRGRRSAHLPRASVPVLAIGRIDRERFRELVQSHVERVQRAMRNEIAPPDHCSLPSTSA